MGEAANFRCNLKPKNPMKIPTRPLSVRLHQEINRLKQLSESCQKTIRWLHEHQDRIAACDGVPDAKVEESQIRLFGVTNGRQAASLWPDADWERVEDAHSINYQATIGGITLCLFGVEEHVQKAPVRRTPLKL